MRASEPPLFGVEVVCSRAQVVDAAERQALVGYEYASSRHLGRKAEGITVEVLQGSGVVDFVGGLSW